MKISIKRLKQLIKEEIENSDEEIIELEEESQLVIKEEGEEVMAAISDIPKEARLIAEKVRAEIEKLSQPSGLDPSVLAEAVAALLTSDF